MRFDPTKQRRQLQELVLNLYRDLSYEEAIRDQAMASWGCGALSTALECYLVGLFVEGSELLHKAQTLLQKSYEVKEKNKVGAGIVLSSLSLTHWFLDRHADVKSLGRCVDWKEAWFNAKPTKPDKVEVQLSLEPYLEAERYETLIARFESAGLTKPKNIRRIQGQGTMCYVLARHRLGLEYSGDEITASLQTFLKRSVKEWLGRYGVYSTAAQWMKIAHWQPGDDPIATLLRCYDYLPGLKPPKYPPSKRR